MARRMSYCQTVLSHLFRLLRMIYIYIRMWEQLMRQLSCRVLSTTGNLFADLNFGRI